VLISVKNTSVLRKQKKTVVFSILISKETRTCTQHPYISTENQRQRCNFGDAAEAGAPAFAAARADRYFAIEQKNACFRGNTENSTSNSLSLSFSLSLSE
jgi:hypothetical protein